jgi:hypothetical protein
LQLPEVELVDVGQHFRCGTGQSNRTLEITTPPSSMAAWICRTDA